MRITRISFIYPIAFILWIGIFFLFIIVTGKKERLVIAKMEPFNVTTIVDFRELMDSDGTHKYMTFNRGGKTYYEAQKRGPGWPSGPACYVFDPEGKLLDWIPDNCESNEWDLKWGQTRRTTTSYEEIIKKLKETQNHVIKTDKIPPEPNSIR